MKNTVKLVYIFVWLLLVLNAFKLRSWSVVAKQLFVLLQFIVILINMTLEQKPGKWLQLPVIILWFVKYLRYLRSTLVKWISNIEFDCNLFFAGATGEVYKTWGMQARSTGTIVKTNHSIQVIKLHLCFFFFKKNTPPVEHFKLR